jgi:hypothetical protein
MWQATTELPADSRSRYRECGKYSLKSGNIENVVDYAKKERCVEQFVSEQRLPT